MVPLDMSIFLFAGDSPECTLIIIQKMQVLCCFLFICVYVHIATDVIYTQ